MPFHTENLDVVLRDRDRLATLRDGGAQVITRLIGTLKRRLPAQAKRDIAAQYNLPATKIGSSLRCTADDTSVTLTAVGRPQTLSNFGPRQNAAGVAVQIEKGKTTQIDHAFIRVPAGAPGAGPQVLIRDAMFSIDADPNVQDIAIIDHNRHGYPIVLLGGLTVADMLRAGDREARLGDFVKQTSDAEIDRLIEVANG